MSFDSDKADTIIKYIKRYKSEFLSRGIVSNMWNYDLEKCITCNTVLQYDSTNENKCKNRYELMCYHCSNYDESTRNCGDHCDNSVDEIELACDGCHLCGDGVIRMCIKCGKNICKDCFGKNLDGHKC